MNKKTLCTVNGTSDYVIVVAEGAGVAVRNAALELQSYIEKISGVKLEIVSDAIAPAPKELVIGKTNREADGEFDLSELGRDGLVIKANEDRIFLIGGSNRGTLYAVYEFLESYLGCRFYTHDVEKLPSTIELSVNIPAEDKQIPVLGYREAYWTEYLLNSDLCVKRKLHSAHRNGVISEDFGGTIYYAGGHAGHTFLRLVPLSEYWETHPEYYRMKEDGTRDDNPDRSQLCLTNPEVLQIAIANVKKILSENPGAEMISVSQMDTGSGTFFSCACENCRAVDEEEGAFSGAVIRFVNAIAEAIEEEFPNVKIHTFAYHYTRQPPAKTKPRDNVIVQLCDIEECHTHPINKGCVSDGKNGGQGRISEKPFFEDFRDWTSICKNLYIWDYTTDFINFNMPFPNFESIRVNAKIFADNNVVGLFEQGADSYQTQSGEFGELRAYLISKILWNPYMTRDEYYAHMDDFLEGVYGPGWKYIREYIDYATVLTADRHLQTFSDVDEIYPVLAVKNPDRALPESLTVEMIRDYENTDWMPYINWYTEITPTSLIVKGEELFAKAMELAETDKQRAKIDKASIQVDYLRSYYLYHVYFDSGKGDISELIENFLEEKAPEMENSVRNQLSEKVAESARRMCTKAYEEYNAFLYKRMQEYGLRVREIYVFQEPILSTIPSRWNIG